MGDLQKVSSLNSLAASVTHTWECPQRDEKEAVSVALFLEEDSGDKWAISTMMLLCVTVPETRDRLGIWYFELILRFEYL